MKALRLLGALWVLPVAAPIWLFYLLPFLWLGWHIDGGWERGVRTFWLSGLRSPAWLRRAWGGWAAHALPFAIVCGDYISSRTERHERRHCDQWLCLGPLFPVVYLVLLLVYGYDRHPLELDAQLAED